MNQLVIVMWLNHVIKYEYESDSLSALVSE